MADAKHTSPDDNSFQLSLVRHVGAGIALVLVVAAAFWGVGQLRGTDEPGNPVIAGSPTPSVAASPDVEVSPSAEPEPTQPPTDASPEPTPEVTGTEVEPSASPAATPSAAPSAAPTASASPTRAGDVPAGDISIQVLDAVLTDGGAKADAATKRFKDDGYRVVASNKAVRAYEVTTVFYSPGQEAKAKQVARAYGFKAIEPKPDNLTDSVNLHIVIGADYE